MIRRHSPSDRDVLCCQENWHCDKCRNHVIIYHFDNEIEEDELQLTRECEPCNQQMQAGELRHGLKRTRSYRPTSASTEKALETQKTQRKAIGGCEICGWRKARSLLRLEN